jgi:CRISPR/Cas system-associated protein Csx1
MSYYYWQYVWYLSQLVGHAQLEVLEEAEEGALLEEAHVALEQVVHLRIHHGTAILRR